MFCRQTFIAFLLLIAPTAAIAQPPAGVPVIQWEFLKIIQDARDRYASGQNDMQKGAARPMRAKAICDLLRRRLRVDGWVGIVTELTTNSEGRGVISIDVGQKTLLRTWNNAISDVGDNTMLDPHGRLFSVAAGLKKGDNVALSGSFLRGDKDCIKEASMTLGGSIAEPWFIFKFDDLAKK